jgi:type I restriction enzyme R subunit
MEFEVEQQSIEFSELTRSQLPALQLLQNLGYTYLQPCEALALRGGRADEALLEGILLKWLQEHNEIHFRGQRYPFSEGNLHNAIQELKIRLAIGLLPTNESIFDLLSLGKSLQQSINGNLKSFSLRYIDWEHPENNLYHVAEEFAVERRGSHDNRRPDLVLFVNGIPLGVIECKSPDIKEPLMQAISQQIRNQKEDEIPNLFQYAQVLLAVCGNGARYATVGTAAKFWGSWKESGEDFEAELKNKVEQPLSREQLQRMYDGLPSKQRMEALNSLNQARTATEQDRTIYALCRPERMLELAYGFTLFDAGEKKIARYQQYFCVQKIMRRIRERDEAGKRAGGVVWHTQGSGKSLTMVFLAKAIALSGEMPNYKIVLVTDRVDLDNQIYGTFKACGKEVEQAKTGKDLAEKLRTNKQRIITTVIDKFEAAVGRQNARNEDANIFVLVDEGHRTQYGAMHARMRQALPNACYIGFTGTPVMKKDKDTVRQFGGLIDVYTIEQAVADQNVVPLLYEGRYVEQEVDAKAIDTWFERITADLNETQIADMKAKYSTADQLNKAAQKVQRIAWDISQHFKDNWQGTGFKGQLVTPDKATALLYKQYLDEFGMVSSEVLISPPDEREGEEDIYQENKQAVQRFWKAMMQKYSSEEKYNKSIISKFKNSDELDIIIVVDKLLTGFDAPRDTVLYLTRNLKNHTLLQAIARVNRLCEGKDYGYILDYYGVLGNLSEALDLYQSLPDFDVEDLVGILTDISEPVAQLAQAHSVLWDTFKEIKNKADGEAFEVLLADEEVRKKFYERLSQFSRILTIALSSAKFMEETPAEKVSQYRKDLKFFHKLKASVQRRYAEVIDFSQYEPRIQKLLGTHVGTGEIEQVTELVNIFDQQAFSEEVEKLQSDAAKADTIAHRTQRVIYERMEQDPVFYKRFSELLRDTIQAYREERLHEKEYLSQTTEIMHSVMNRSGDNIPAKLNGHEVAKAYFGIVKDSLNNQAEKPAFEAAASAAALAIEQMVEKNRIVNWADNLNIQNRMKNEIEDFLFDWKEEHDIDLSYDQIDDILEQSIHVARVRCP